MKKDVVVKLHASFEELVQRDEETGGEYWLARDLQGLLGYAKCRVSCDHIPRRSWALFRARDVMRGVIESFKAEQAA